MSFGQKSRQMVSPFQGEPETTMTKDEHGNPAFMVRIAEVTPQGASCADGLAGLTGFIFFIFMFAFGAGTGNPLVFIICFMLPFWLYTGIQRQFHEAMRTELTVMFTPTEFRIRNGAGCLIYDRTLTHRFVMIKHDKAREEREQIDRRTRRAQMRGEVIAPKRYFDEAFHIVFEYMGQRCDVVTVYDEKRAAAVATRLMAIDKIMDMKNQMGGGEALDPVAQWGNAPGTIPHS